jgi:hypothetical protein
MAQAEMDQVMEAVQVIKKRRKIMAEMETAAAVITIILIVPLVLMGILSLVVQLDQQIIKEMAHLIITEEIQQVLVEILEAETLDQVQVLAKEVETLLQAREEAAQVQVVQLKEEVRRLSRL